MTALTDRVAVVTGASMGIGAGLAAMLADEGARVVLAARREAALERVAEGIRRAGGVAVPVVTDLADDTSLANLVARTRAELGSIDILVNNAGYAVWKSLEATSLAEWDHTLSSSARRSSSAPCATPCRPDPRPQPQRHLRRFQQRPIPDRGRSPLGIP
jgi:3-oxoacyl-[acyl-carrier protein] reductase